MKKVLPFIVLLVCCFGLTGSAQYYTNQNKVWMFGQHAGLDFNSGSPVPINSAFTYTSAIEGCAAVCDVNGNLLFYTNGLVVYNRNNAIMPNGDSIVPFCPISSTQGAVIMPVPNHSNQYYIFSVEQAGGCSSLIPNWKGRLAYSIVDMSLDSGLGAVIPTAMGIIMDSFMSEKMTAIPGTNCDAWVVVHEKDSAKFVAFNISAAGVGAPVISNVGLITGVDDYEVGVIKGSPNGRKVVCQLSYEYGSQLFDFDGGSGLFSNCLDLLTPIDHEQGYGAEFSPDNSKLYLSETNTSDTGFIIQFDLSLPTDSAIIASKTKVGWLGYGNLLIDLKLAVDNKIYFNNNINSLGYSLACIANPNVAGVSCSYESGMVNLYPDFAAMGFPNLVVNIPSAILGPSALCVGDTATFTDSIAGGHWSSSNTAVATIDSISGIAVGIDTGTTTISYYDGTCVTLATLTILQSAPPIAGNRVLCIGGTTTLADAATGGIWSTADTGTISLSPINGRVTALTLGAAVITYSLGMACSVYTTVNIIGALPPITGTTVVCGGTVATLSDSVLGGYWMGTYLHDVTGFNTGTVKTLSGGGASTYYDTITYFLGGCKSTTVLTVNPLPTIYSGLLVDVVCVGHPFTMTASPAGGVWSSPDSAVVFGTSSHITLTDTGLFEITYTAPTTGCFLTTLLHAIPYLPHIQVDSVLCIGTTSLLYDSISGGTWSGGSSVVGVVASVNEVIGLSAGTDVVTYSIGSGCPVATVLVTVDTSTGPGTIVGSASVCLGNSITLADASAGGSWSCSDTLIAVVDSSTGVVTGVAVGDVYITYTATNGCQTEYPEDVYSCPAVIAKHETPLQLYLFPNPATNVLTIAVTGSSYTAFAVANMLGQQTVVRQTLVQGDNLLDLASFAPGVYTITFFGDAGTLVKRFIRL
jgi:Secretion system C-terminal sorting domain